MNADNCPICGKGDCETFVLGGEVGSRAVSHLDCVRQAVSDLAGTQLALNAITKGNMTACAELAALKARRCETCRFNEKCVIRDESPEGSDRSTNFSCSRWQPREEQP